MTGRWPTSVPACSTGSRAERRRSCRAVRSSERPEPARAARSSARRLTTVEEVPELPEVETIRRQLAPHLEGRRIVDAEILDARWTRPEAPGRVEAGLRGATVERVGRAGK